MQTNSSASAATLVNGDNEKPVSLESVLCTEELNQRPSRPPNYRAENQALVALMKELNSASGKVLQMLAETAIDLCRGHSAGISLLEKDGSPGQLNANGNHFRWYAVAGKWAPLIWNTTTRRDDGPCGTVLDRNCTLLFSNAHRYYTQFAGVEPPLIEGLLAPFHVDGQAVGTVWVVAHDESRKFDSEDQRVLETLSTFAAIAYQVLRDQQELGEREQRFRCIIDALPAAIYTTDAKGNVTHFNPAAVQLSGRTPELGTDRWCVSWKLYRPDGTVLPHDKCPMAVALREGRAVRGEEIIVERPDGTRAWVEPNPTPIFDDAGNVTGGINMLVDITDRKRAEEAMAHLAEIVKSSDDAIISKSLDGIIRSWNRGAERLFGYAAEEVIGKPVMLLIPSDRVDEEPAILERLRRGERIEHYETVRQRKDGSVVDISLTVSPVRDAGGRITGAAKIARDISARKQAEKLLKDADRRKNEFLAILAHELRNPLAPIRNAVQVLRLKGGDETVQSVSETIERQVGQLVRLVDDLLDVNRISRGKIELRRSRVELASIVHHAVEAVRPICENMGHKLSITLPQHPLYLDADSARLAQVLSNLLNNACKFTNNGGCITLTAEQQAEHVVVRIRDNGIGIAANQLPRIFNMFAQVDTSLERSVSGLGIGLSLVKNLVEMHGGTVEARSEGIGHGSEFVVRLPINVATPKPRPSVPIVSKPTVFVPRRILVVDDNRDSAKTLAMLLNLTGHQTHTAFDGLEAVAAAETFQPDIILLDIGLPKLNGYETAITIRAQPWGKDMLLVAVTGWGQEDDRQKSKDAGFDAHLVKPVDHAALTKLLANTIKNAT